MARARTVKENKGRAYLDAGAYEARRSGNPRQPLVPNSRHLNRNQKGAFRHIQLPTRKRELLPLEERRGARRRALYAPTFLQHGDVSDGEESDVSEEFDDEAEVSDWDEEATLAELCRNSSEPDDARREDLTALANGFRQPMNAQSQKLREHIVRALVPATKAVKDAHETISDEIDGRFSQGFVNFDDVCQRTEKLAIKDEEEIREQTQAVADRTKELLGQLKMAYEDRDKLWVKLEEDLGDHMQRAEELLKDVVNETEQRIDQLQKKAKSIEKSSGKTSQDTEKMIKQLLEST